MEWTSYDSNLAWCEIFLEYTDPDVETLQHMESREEYFDIEVKTL